MFYAIKYKNHYLSAKVTGNLERVDVLTAGGAKLIKNAPSLHAAKCRLTRLLNKQKG